MANNCVAVFSPSDILQQSQNIKCRREAEQHANEAVLRQLLCWEITVDSTFKGIRSFVLI